MEHSPSPIQEAPSTFAVRSAVSADVSALCELDQMAQQDNQRRVFIEQSVQDGDCYVIERDHQIVGYVVLEYTFYGQGFVSMLYIHPDHRREGLGTMLMQHLESLCRTRKLFTSTNLSNLPMQSLLAKLGYELSGIIHHLDEGDPELVYVKFLESKAG